MKNVEKIGFASSAKHDYGPAKETNKMPYFLEVGIKEDTAKEMDYFFDLALNFYSTDIEQSHQHNRDDIRNLLFATIDITSELNVELDYDNF